MPILSSNVVPASATAYEIEQSLRLNSADSSYLTFTPSSNGEDLTWTWSAWVKKCKTNGAANQTIFSVITNSAGSTTTVFFGIEHTSRGSTFSISDWNDWELQTDGEYRDVGGWYHFVVSWDVTQSTESDRVKIYVNGEQASLTENTAAPGSGWDGYPPQNHPNWMNQTYPHYLGNLSTTYSQYMDGYLAEVIMVDGQALDASYFGETGDYGEWKPIEYTGTYGTNGWKLNFSNASDLGEDSSGNGNDWTANNLASTDVVLDSPTNNFATLNPLLANDDANLTISEGNLKAVGGGTAWRPVLSSIAIPSTGKWYCEFLCNAHTDGYSSPGIGFSRKYGDSENSFYLGSGDSITVFASGGVYSGGTTHRNVYSEEINVGDVFGIIVDMDNSKVYMTRNGSYLNSGDPSAGTGAVFTNSDWAFSGKELLVGFDVYNTVNAGTMNFGQDSSFAGNKTAQGNTDDNNIGDFYYEPPSGYLALCTANLPEPDVIPSENFNIVTYSGQSGDQSITGVGFQPDLVWIKHRNGAGDHVVTDAVRGVTKDLHINTTDSEATEAEGLQSFDTDGFTLGDDQGNYNRTTRTYISWNWKANGSGSSNTNGSITSTVSANQDAGFSIITYTGAGSSSDTFGHGLSQTPELLLFKRRNTNASWYLWHTYNGTGQRLLLNATTGLTEDSGFITSLPTSSVVYPGSSTGTNETSSNFLCYAFHSVEGFSKVGSYTGNGNANGTFVYTGFRPAFVLQKNADYTGTGWQIYDTTRDPYNPLNTLLYANTSGTDDTIGAIDYLSNGFKYRNDWGAYNNSGDNHIYIAFAENPFKYTNAR